MSKQKDKELVSEAEKFLQGLLDNNKITLPLLQELSKKLQKANTPNNKKKEESKTELLNYIENKIEIKEYLEKDESHYGILSKAAQKILSKSQAQEPKEQSEKQKEPKGLFKVEKKNLIEIFNKSGENYFQENQDSLYVYIEYLCSEEEPQDPHNLPFFTFSFYPKEKKINLYMKCKDNMNLSFAQVDYLLNSNKEIFLNIDYYSLFQNHEIKSTRTYKGNCMDLSQFEKIIKENPIIKNNELNIKYIENDYQKFQKEFKEYCDCLKGKINKVVTNNKDFFNGLFI